MVESGLDLSPPASPAMDTNNLNNVSFINGNFHL